jgi:Helix-loop-helix DNA-binding domain
VEKGVPPRRGTNTAAAADTGTHHGPDSSQQVDISSTTPPADDDSAHLLHTKHLPDQQTVAGPPQEEEKAASPPHQQHHPPATLLPEDDDLQNMTASITSFQVSPDLMEQTAFHSYSLHDDKFDHSAYAASHANTYDFPTFPDPPPLPGNPLFDEKETAFMSSFFDTVDQNTSFDHDFQDGLAQWAVPNIDLRKSYDNAAWTNQANNPPSATTTGSNASAAAHTNNMQHTYSISNPSYTIPQYEPATAAEPNYSTASYGKPANPVIPQQYNPSAQNFLAQLHNANNNPNDMSRPIFAHRNSHPNTASTCDPLFSAYPSLNIPVQSPSAVPSALQTPNSTPKIPNYSFLKHELHAPSESPPPVVIPHHRLSFSHVSHMTGPPSSYAASSASSTSPQPHSNKPPRKKRRENLSEAQKRLNHITSEQKRRNLIQEGFNEIHILVPTLRNSRERSDSKSTVLLKTVEWICQLRDGNDRLRRMLHQR